MSKKNRRGRGAAQMQESPAPLAEEVGRLDLQRTPTPPAALALRRKREAADPKSQGRVMIANAQECAAAGDLEEAERWVKLAERLAAASARIEALRGDAEEDVDALREELRRRLALYAQAEQFGFEDARFENEEFMRATAPTEPG